MPLSVPRSVIGLGPEMEPARATSMAATSSAVWRGRTKAVLSTAQALVGPTSGSMNKTLGKAPPIPHCMVRMHSSLAREGHRSARHRRHRPRSQNRSLPLQVRHRTELGTDATLVQLMDSVLAILVEPSKRSSQQYLFVSRLSHQSIPATTRIGSGTEPQFAGHRCSAGSGTSLDRRWTAGSSELGSESVLACSLDCMWVPWSVLVSVPQ